MNRSSVGGAGLSLKSMRIYSSYFYDSSASFQNVTTGVIAITGGTVNATTIAKSYTSAVNGPASTFLTSTDAVARSTYYSSGTGTSGSTSSGSVLWPVLTFVNATSTSSVSDTVYPTTTQTKTESSSAYSTAGQSHTTTFSTTTSQTTSSTTNSYTTSTVGASTTSRTAPSAILSATFINTVYQFASTDAFVLWLPTITDSSASGALSDMAQSYTTDLTCFASDYFSSASGTIATSSTNFSATTFSSTFSSSTFSGMEGEVSVTVTMPTAHRRFLGSFTTSGSGDQFSSYDTTSISQDEITVQISGHGLSTFTTSISVYSSLTSTAFTTFAANEIADDQQYPFGDNVNNRGSRTTTMRITGTATTTIGTALDTFTNTSGLASNQTGALSFTHWQRNFPDIRALYTGAGNSYYIPTAASGLDGFGTVGEISPIFKGISIVAADAAVAQYAFDLNPVLFRAVQSNASAIFRDPFTFTASYYGLDDGGTATLKFSSGAGVSDRATLVASIASGTSILSGSIIAQLVTGFNTAAETGHTSSYDFRAGFGGAQSHIADRITARYDSGVRAMTTNNSAGGSSTATTNRTVFSSTTVPTDQLIFESGLHIYAVAKVSQVSNNSVLILDRFQTYASIDLSLPIPHQF